MDPLKRQLKEPVVLDHDRPMEEVMSVGDWIGAFLVLSIPFVGLIALISWAGDSDKKQRTNFAKAVMVFYAISCSCAVVLCVLSALAGK